MNALMPLAGTPLTMSSSELADLTGKEHKNVIRDIRAMLAEISADGSSLSHVREEKDGRGYTSMFHLNRELTDTLLTGYSAALRRRVVARWHQLEASARKPALPDFSDPVIAARAWADAKEAEQMAVAQLALAAPKVTYADAMLNSDGTVLVRDAAKTIGVPVRKLEKALREKGVILPDNAPAARYVAQGYFKESLHSYDTNTHGRQLSRVARVTGRGLEFLRRFVERHAELFAAELRNVLD